ASDDINLVRGQLRKHRQRERFARESLCYREGADLQGEVAVCLVQMNWLRVMDAGLDTSLGQMSTQGVAIGGLDDEQVIDVRRRGCGRLDDKIANTCELRRVSI